MKPTNAVGADILEPRSEDNVPNSMRSVCRTAGRKILACCLGIILCIIIGLVFMNEESGGSVPAARTAEATRVAQLRARISVLNFAIENNRRREDAQTRGGYGLSDEQYWGQFERNTQEHRDLVLKKAVLEGELKAMISKLPSQHSR